MLRPIASGITVLMVLMLAVTLVGHAYASAVDVFGAPDRVVTKCGKIRAAAVQMVASDDLSAPDDMSVPAGDRSSGSIVKICSVFGIIDDEDSFGVYRGASRIDWVFGEHRLESRQPSPGLPPPRIGT